MGRKIEVDIEKLFEVVACVQEGRDATDDIPNVIFDMIGDCKLADIMIWKAKSNGEKGLTVKERFKIYITDKMFSELEAEERGRLYL